IGRWLAIDPLASKYAYASPYNFTLNNPILFVDPDGREVTLHGEDAKATLAQLQKTTALQLSMDANGKLSAQLPQEPIVFSKLDMALLDAINDKDVNVNLYTTKAEWYDSKDGSGSWRILVGAYEGSEVVNGKVETTQLFNLEMAEKLEGAGIDKSGNAAAHEVLESFYGGKDDPGGSYGTGYKSAHKKAENSDDYKTDNTKYKDKSTKTGVTEFGMSKKDGSKRVKLTDDSKESKSKKFEKK
nr:hypothetical protein [Chitinophagaceae bacterium]MCU0384045.1 hypothetical protein [Cyclobacteriaceae bacterium]